MSTLRFDTLANSNDTVDTDTVIAATPRAWNYYDEDGAGGAILNSFNVASLVDGGVGIFTTNVTNVLPNPNYAVIGKAAQRSGTAFPGSAEDASSTGTRPDSTSGYTVITQDNDTNGFLDFNFCSTTAIS